MRIAAILTLSLAAFLAVGCAATPRVNRPLADDSTGPLVGIKEQLGSDQGPFVLIVRFTLKDAPEARAEFARLAQAANDGTAREPGNILYRFSADPADPRRITLYEEWRSYDDLRHHLVLTHTTEFITSLGTLTEGDVSIAVLRPLHTRPR